MIAACKERVSLIGIGSYAPERVVDNDEIATMVETSDEWISQRTGIRGAAGGRAGESSGRSAPRRHAAPSRAPARLRPTST